MPRLITLAGGVLLLLMTLLAGAAAAQYPPSGPGGSVDDDTPDPGQEINVSGGGWKPGSEVTIGGCGFEDVTAEVDDNGDFTMPVTIPEDQDPGECVVTISGDGLDDQPSTVEQTITVNAVQEEPVTEVEAIAEGGFPATVLAALALALLLAGAGALVLGRRSA